MEAEVNARNLIIEILNELEVEIEYTYRFYKELEDKIPTDEHWKFYQSWYPAGEHFVNKEVAHPSEYLENMLELIALQKEAIDNFSIDQLAAFYLGMGFRWLDLPFWGFGTTQVNIESTRKTIEFYKELMPRLPEDKHWTIDKQIPKGLLFLPPKTVKPIDYLSKRLELLEAQLTILIEIFG